jgi:ferredoxin
MILTIGPLLTELFRLADTFPPAPEKRRKRTPTPIRHELADAAFDAAACIGCGACVATCKNSSAAIGKNP